MLFRQTGRLPALILANATSAANSEFELLSRYPAGGVVVGVSSSSTMPPLGIRGLQVLEEGSHAVQAVELDAAGGAVVVVAAGGSAVDTMYACFTLLEHLGARFRVHEDVLDDSLVHAYRADEVRV